MPEVLRVENLSAGHDGARVLHELSFSLNAGESLALLGRNGMGKTTLLTTLMGLSQRYSGRLWFQSGEITHLPSHLRVCAGLGWVPQEREVFSSLTVEENLLVACRPGQWTLPRVYELFPALAERRSRLADQLSGGEQQMLAIGRALMLNPALLLLDEPLEGLAPMLARQLLEIMQTMLPETGLSMIVVEQHAREILRSSTRALVLERGQIAFAGSSASLLQQDDLLDELLGAAGAGSSRSA